MIKYSLYLLLLILLVNCSSEVTEKSDVNRLHDIWALEFIDGEKVVLNENIKSLPVIEIYVKEERIHGNTSCNTINGSVDIDENQITFSKIITTEMACPGDVEQKFLAALNAVNNYKIEKLRLLLYEDEDERLVFRKID